MASVALNPSVTYTDLLRAFTRIGLLSFGGPVGQIALMHRELVEEREWIGAHHPTFAAQVTCLPNRWDLAELLLRQVVCGSRPPNAKYTAAFPYWGTWRS